MFVPLPLPVKGFSLGVNSQSEIELDYQGQKVISEPLPTPAECDSCLTSIWKGIVSIVDSFLSLFRRK
jgi:hypothetical protein